MRTLVKSLCSVLDTALASRSSCLPESAADDCSDVVASLAPAIMAAVAPIACQPPSLHDKGALAAFNHSLECFRLLASADAAAVAEFLTCALAPDGKISSQKPGANRCWGALAVLKHVHQDVGPLLDGLLCAALRHAAPSRDPLVRVKLAHLIMAVAPMELQLEVRRDCFSFLIASVSCTFAQLSVGAESARAPSSMWFGASAGRAKAANTQEDLAFVTHEWWWPQAAGGIEEMQTTCGNTCVHLAKAAPQWHHVLWPWLLTFLGDAKYSASVPDVCRAVAALAQVCHKSPVSPRKEPYMITKRDLLTLLMRSAAAVSRPARLWLSTMRNTPR